jgi:hypothetical protein
LFEDIEQQLSVSEKDERDERGIILTDLLEWSKRFIKYIDEVNC